MYKIFENIIEKEVANSYVIGAKELLKELGIEFEVLNGAKKDIGTEGKGLNEEAFLYNCAYNLSLAKEHEIVCVEDSSYISLNFTKMILLEDDGLRLKIFEKLKKDGVEPCLDIKVLHICDLLYDLIGVEKLSTLVKNSFKDFKVGIFEGNKTLSNKKTKKILESIGARVVSFDSSDQSDGYEIFMASKQIAQKLAGKILLDAFDNAADFVIANDTRSFFMFDSRQNSIERVVGREINLPIYSISHIVLMALGCVDKEKLGVNLHKVKTTMI